MQILIKLKLLILNFNKINIQNKKIMSTKGIIEKILSQPIEKLVLSNKRPPNLEALRLYREILKFSKTLNWNNVDGTPW